MLGWIIPVLQYVLIIATGCIIVGAVFALLEACQKKDAKIWWVGTGKWSDKSEHWLDEASSYADNFKKQYKARQNGEGGE